MAVAHVLLLLAFLACLQCVTATHKQCHVQRRSGVALGSVHGEATVLREFTDIPSLQDCIKQCCQLAHEGCNAASFVNASSTILCAIAKCQPWDDCVWKYDYDIGSAAKVDAYDPAATGAPTAPSTTFGTPDSSLINVTINSPSKNPQVSSSTTNPTTTSLKTTTTSTTTTTTTAAAATTVSTSTKNPVTSSTWSGGNLTTMAAVSNETAAETNSKTKLGIGPQNPFVTTALVLGVVVTVIILGVLARKAFKVYNRAEYKPLKEGFLQSYSD